MSLLLDALKRAEQEKLTRQGDRRPGADAPQGAPAPVSGSAPALALQALPSAAAPRNEAEAAQAVFKAKTASAAPRNRGALWAIVGAAAVVLLAAGAYVWYSIQSLSPSATPYVRAKLSRFSLPQPAPAAKGVSPVEQPEGPRPPAANAAMEPRAAPAPASAPAPVAAPQKSPSADAARTSEARAADRIEDASVPASAPPLKLARANEGPRVPPEVTAGYEALRSGNLEAARRSYAAAVGNDPTNVDAQLGLATVEARAGNRSLAALHYRQVLETDPRNPTALAGLAALAQDARPEAVEAQLRAEIARTPDSAALHLALGDLYASHARWTEAQAEFFEAHRLDPGNADTTYNLAVSLDHLGQARVAADFYRRALEGAGEQSAQFDAAGAARRLSELR